MLTASPSLIDVELVERLLRRFGLAFGVAKRGEIVLADQSLRGVMHRVGVERPRQPPDLADVEREIGAAIGDAIEVMALLRREPRLEAYRARSPPDSTPIGCGRRCALRPSRKRPGTKCLAMSQCATCPSACTPASVRPAPWTRTRSPQIALTASSSAPCTEAPLSCSCQPQNGAPSYSMMSL